MSKILVVDDDPDAVEFVKVVFEMQDDEVVTATNGEDGLAAAAAENPDIIILDVQMPDMDGFHVFEKLRRNDQTKQIPVIMFTAVGARTGIHFDGKSMAEYIGSEPDGYIEKPVDAERLRQIVADLLA